MSYIHVMEQAILDDLEENDGFSIARRTYKELKDKPFVEGFDMTYERFFFDNFRSIDESVKGVTLFKIKYMASHGHALIFPIGVDGVPYPDKEIEENRRVLQNIAEPFTTDIWCGYSIGDGHIEWNPEHPKAPQFDPIGKFYFDKRNNYMPLEIGYCHPMTILWHLMFGGSVARWSYKSKYIWALKITSEAELFLRGPHLKKPKPLQTRNIIMQPEQLTLF